VINLASLLKLIRHAVEDAATASAFVNLTMVD